ncbi:hypothetical protein [Desulfonatronospira sp.]|uniref:DUF7680 family protein n=1 Tax=Desulfonatronospira sp. TaxID=1962951 RepID=UPI0025BC0EB6|nr:hypothetical protein [Desulfonatronospira sp.]
MDLTSHHLKKLEPLVPLASYVLRITEWKDYPVPVLVIKERRAYQMHNKASGQENRPAMMELPVKRILVEIGSIYGEPLRRCLPVLKQIVSTVRDQQDIPLELQHYMNKNGLRLRLNLPLDEEAGAKLGLLARLQVRVKEMDRIELMARRIARFSREEAEYWLYRTTTYGSDANRWALSGLRIILGGQPGDPAVGRMLSRMRES